jgi:hypothetical protein
MIVSWVNFTLILIKLAKTTVYTKRSSEVGTVILFEACITLLASFVSVQGNRYLAIRANITAIDFHTQRHEISQLKRIDAVTVKHS